MPAALALELSHVQGAHSAPRGVETTLPHIIISSLGATDPASEVSPLRGSWVGELIIHAHRNAMRPSNAPTFYRLLCRQLVRAADCLLELVNHAGLFAAP
ncbi:MAG: hypothetical protein K2K82_09640 [Muribaculaceae bacterium]|nr:hypothetical protein [Muribaculaceae bacterium]